jgi:hypothetical protein
MQSAAPLFAPGPGPRPGRIGPESGRARPPVGGADLGQLFPPQYQSGCRRAAAVRQVWVLSRIPLAVVRGRRLRTEKPGERPSTGPVGPTRHVDVAAATNSCRLPAPFRSLQGLRPLRRVTCTLQYTCRGTIRQCGKFPPLRLPLCRFSSPDAAFLATPLPHPLSLLL